MKNYTILFLSWMPFTFNHIAEEELINYGKACIFGQKHPHQSGQCCGASRKTPYKVKVTLWEELQQKDKNWYSRWSYEPQFKGKVRNFDMGVKSLAGLESPKKKSMFGNAKLINLSVIQVF